MKVRVANIDNEAEMEHMELSEVNTEAITSKIGGLLQILMELDAESERSEGDSLHPLSDMRDSTRLTSSAIAGRHRVDNVPGGSITLRATDVHSIVEEKKRREADRKAAAIVSREREMFLRAALQLLDQRESGVDDNEAPSSESRRPNVKLPRGPGGSENDTIRMGPLKKYSKGSLLKGTGSLSYHWIGKYIELRHGSFAYYEQDHSSLFEIMGGASNSKVIKLTVDSCYCKPVKLSDKEEQAPGFSQEDSADLDDCVFELSIKGGQQRLWRAGSRRERDIWVRSINTAMIGSAGDFTLDGVDPSDHTIYVPQSPQVVPGSKKTAASSGGMSNVGSSATTTSASGDGANTPGGASSSVDMNLGLDLYLSDKQSSKNKAGTRKITNLLIEDASLASSDSDSGPDSHGIGRRRHSARLSPKGGSSSSGGGDGGKPSSSEGAAAPYAEDIAKFIAIRMAIQGMTSSDSYRKLMRRLSSEKLSITVPVFYVKASLGGAFQMNAQDMLSRQTLLNVNNSQVWKDLMRDTIRINGELVSGNRGGAEGMVGALVRNIVDKADAIRTILRVAALNEGQKEGQQGNSHNMDYPTFDLTEGQVLACARDLLVLCGRTQSGGDTYFCVDNLLVDKDSCMCFLAPNSADTPPLEFYVDIVESGVVGGKSKRHKDAISAANAASTREDAPHAAAIAAANASAEPLLSSPPHSPSGAASSSLGFSAFKPPGSGSEANLASMDQERGAGHQAEKEKEEEAPIPLRAASIKYDGGSAIPGGGKNGSSELSADESGATTRDRENSDNVPVNFSREPSSTELLDQRQHQGHTPARTANGGAPGELPTINTDNAVAGGYLRVQGRGARNQGVAGGTRPGALELHPPSEQRYEDGLHLNIDLGDDDSQDGSPRPPSPRGGRRGKDGPSPSLGLDSESGNACAWEDTASTVSDLTLDTMQMQADSHAHHGQAAPPLGAPYRGGAPKSHVDPSAAFHPAFKKAGHGTFLPPPAGPGDKKYPLEAVNPQGGPRKVVPTNMNRSLFDGRLPSSHGPNGLHGQPGGSGGDGNGAQAHHDEQDKAKRTRSQPLDSLRQARRSSLSSTGSPRPGLPGTDKDKETRRSKLLQSIEDTVPDLYISTMCIRVTVKGETSFRVCDLDPQDEESGTWATVKGTFKQVFFIKSNCNGRPAMSDRLVSIDVSSVR